MEAIQKSLNKFLKLKVKIEKIKADINFLKKCRKHKIFPSFINVKINIKNHTTKQVVEKAKKHWLEVTVKNHYRNLANNEIVLYELHLYLAKIWTSDTDILKFRNWDEFDRNVHEVVASKIKAKNILIKKKFKKLIQKSSAKQILQHSQVNGLVQNLSTTILNDKETQFLNKGLNFANKPKQPPIREIVVDIESGIKHLKEDAKGEIRRETFNIISKSKNTDHKISRSEREDMDVLRSLKQKNVVYVKADKNNGVVVLDNIEYDNKIYDLIEEGTYIELHESPLKELQNEVLEILELYTDLIDSKTKYKLRIRNPRIPIIYATIKTHKPSKDLRPIISNIGAPNSQIAKWLIQEFRSLNPPKGRDVENCYELVDKIKNISIKRNEKMVSFDVKSLYPSVPVNIALEYLEMWLLSQKLPVRIINMYIEMTKLCVNDTCFQFRDGFYCQTEGLAMGNPVSSFLANLYMCYFENELSKDKRFPRIWYRYVDDVFAIINQRKTAETLNFINSKHNNIQFTVEEEQNNRLPFLELVIENREGKIEFDIYRKPTFLPRYTIRSSFHNENTKKAAFNSMIYRMLNIPLSDENKELEMNKIVEIAQINGYNRDFVQKIHNKMMAKKAKKEATTLLPVSDDNRNNKKRISMIYYPKISNKLKKVFRKHNIELVTKSSNKTGCLLSKTKDKIKDIESSGIYEIACSMCDHTYIGQTSRNIFTRYKDHQSATINRKPDRSAIAKHMLDNNHTFSISDLKLIKNVTQIQKLDAEESIEIRKRDPNKLMNDNHIPLNSRLLHFAI